MATNLAMVTTGVPSMAFDASLATGMPVWPDIAWPATGGLGGTKKNAGVYLPMVAPLGSIAAGGATTGQLFPVGNR